MLWNWELIESSASSANFELSHMEKLVHFLCFANAIVHCIDILFASKSPNLKMANLGHCRRKAQKMPRLDPFMKGGEPSNSAKVKMFCDWQ